MIEKELNKIMKIANEENYPINAEKAFNILICSLYCYKSLNYKKIGLI
ncbi:MULTISPECIES: hypothetical protein [Mammaliicoccus]|nr:MULTISPECIES: hypothetical protein [Mammaliicoccus]